MMLRGLSPAAPPRVCLLLFPTCLPLCIAYFILYRLGLHINTPASGFVKSQATAAPFPPLLSCVTLRPTPNAYEPAEQQLSF